MISKVRVVPERFKNQRSSVWEGVVLCSVKKGWQHRLFLFFTGSLGHTSHLFGDLLSSEKGVKKEMKKGQQDAGVKRIARSYPRDFEVKIKHVLNPQV